MYKRQVLALSSGVTSIATDSGQIVVRLGELTKADRSYLTRKLDGKARLGKDQIWLSLGKSSAWTETLLDVLHILAGARARHEGAVSAGTQRNP